MAAHFYIFFVDNWTQGDLTYYKKYFGYPHSERYDELEDSIADDDVFQIGEWAFWDSPISPMGLVESFFGDKLHSVNAKTIHDLRKCLDSNYVHIQSDRFPKLFALLHENEERQCFVMTL